MVLNMEQVDLIKEFAVGYVFSYTAGMGHAALVEELEEGNIPEGVVVWEPFEDLNSWELVEHIEEQYSIFEVFSERLMGRT